MPKNYWDYKLEVFIYWESHRRLSNYWEDEYFPVLISDVSAASPSSRQEAAIGNVIQVFGWRKTRKSF